VTKDLAAQDEKSIGKKSWLADTFFTPHGATTKRRPSISNILRRKNSTSQASSRKNSVVQDVAETVLPRVPQSASSDVPPLPRSNETLPADAIPHPIVPAPPSSTSDVVSPPLRLAALPSTLSAVEEQVTPVSPAVRGFQRGSMRVRDSSKTDTKKSARQGDRSRVLLDCLDGLLAAKPENRPGFLHEPPRKLIAVAETLQVVNNHVSHNTHWTSW
jgi:hypothetical protein